MKHWTDDIDTLIKIRIRYYGAFSCDCGLYPMAKDCMLYCECCGLCTGAHNSLEDAIEVWNKLVTVANNKTYCEELKEQFLRTRRHLSEYMEKT